jgi:hypothetical protein
MHTFYLRSWLRFAVVLLGALTGYASSAWACPAACIGSPLRTFGNGVSVPGNLVYFKVLADDPGELSLKSVDGKEIPANVRTIGQDRVYAPIDPIPADTLVVLTYPSSTCESDAPKATYVFQTRAPLDMQLQDGSLTATEYGLISGLTEFATNMNVGPIAFQRLIYRPLGAAGAAPHLIDIDVRVDGQRISPSFPASWDSPIEVHAVCTASDPIPQPVGTCHETIFGPGRHSVTAQPHIVGQLDPPPTELDIDFDLACGVCRADPMPTARTDASMLDAGSPASSVEHTQDDPAERTDASTLDAGPSADSLGHTQDDASSSTPSPGVSRAAGGCSATTVRAADGATTWLVLLALMCLRRRTVCRQS